MTDPPARKPRTRTTAARAKATPAQRRRQALITAVALVVIGIVFAVTWMINHHRESASTAASTSSAASTNSAASTTAPRSVNAKKPASPKKSATAKKSASPKKPESSPRRTSTPAADTAAIPAHVLRTLALVDAGDWPAAANSPGTHGGDTFRNNEGKLPPTDGSGARISYREWDVNAKQPGRGRDAERIITGSDGSAWYTADHYRTFTRIRGPR